jgi:IS1 family transposase
MEKPAQAHKTKNVVNVVAVRDSREVLGVAFGKRDAEGARALWNSLPAVCRQCAVCYTDFWEAYKKVFPR